MTHRRALASASGSSQDTRWSASPRSHTGAGCSPTSAFDLDGYRWLSVEHCFQAHKFKTLAPAYFESFVQARALLAKYTQNAAHRAALLATGEAIEHGLMRVRHQLANNPDAR